MYSYLYSFLHILHSCALHLHALIINATTRLSLAALLFHLTSSLCVLVCREVQVLGQAGDNHLCLRQVALNTLFRVCKQGAVGLLCPQLPVLSPALRKKGILSRSLQSLATDSACICSLPSAGMCEKRRGACARSATSSTCTQFHTAGD